MLHVPPSVAIYVYTRHADLRKGFDGLSGLVRQEFQADPLDGSLFLFFNRRRDRGLRQRWQGLTLLNDEFATLSRMSLLWEMSS